MIDYIRSIVSKQRIEVGPDYTQFGLNLYFSKFRNCVLIIQDLQNKILTNEMHYDYLFNNIPYGFQKRLEFPKEDKYKDTIIQNISDYYKIGLDEAETYLSLADIDEIEKIKEYYK